jgi:hypothetical protein
MTSNVGTKVAKSLVLESDSHLKIKDNNDEMKSVLKRVRKSLHLNFK